MQGYYFLYNISVRLPTASNSIGYRVQFFFFTEVVCFTVIWRECVCYWSDRIFVCVNVSILFVVRHQGHFVWQYSLPS